MAHNHNNRRRRRHQPPARKKSWTFPLWMTWTIMALAGYGAYTVYVQLTS